jgi:DNA sulfur modification protein DndE
MADRMFTSGPVEDILNDLRRATKLEYAALARIALALSLRAFGSGAPPSLDTSGKEIRWISIFGDDEDVYRTLLCMAHGKRIHDDELFSDRSVVKDHIDNGTQMLWEEFTAANRDPIRLLAALAEQMAPATIGAGRVSAIDTVVGVDVQTGQRVVLALNDTTQHPNPHVAIAGKPGVGKTQLLLKLLADIRQQTDYATNLIIIDYKGDIAANERFVELVQARAYNLPGDQLPINPFVMLEYDEKSLTLSTREKAESFASIDARFGTVQKGNLAQAIRAAYDERKQQARRFPDFREVFACAAARYKADGKQDDTLIEVLRDLSQFQLFWEHSNPSDPLDSVMQHTFVVDLHGLPVLKELVAYIVIERLYKEMSALPDSAVDGGRREVRTVLVIDEAHNYLPQRNLFLEKVIREGRSKGVACFFASQSPGDYVQKAFNFRELLGAFLTFQCDGATAAEIQELLGCDARTARSLQSEVPHLKPFEGVSRPIGNDGQFTRFVAEAFYKAYP